MRRTFLPNLLTTSLKIRDFCFHSADKLKTKNNHTSYCRCPITRSWLHHLFRPTCGRNYIHKWMVFFCSDNFGRSIYSSYGNAIGTIKKLVLRRIRNWNFFFWIPHLSKSYRYLIVISTRDICMILFAFSEFFVQIKNSLQKYYVFSQLFFTLQNESILCYQKSDKKANSGLMKKFTIKKLEFNLRAVLFRKVFLFIVLFLMN